MKKNKLFLITIALLSSSHAFAEWQFQGGGRVIDEHKSVSPGVIAGGIIDAPIKPSNHYDTASAFAKANDATSKANTNLTVYGDHGFNAKNITPNKQRYKYHYQICADDTKCFTYTGNIELEPNATGQNQSQTFVTVQLPAGRYVNKADTTFYGDKTVSASHQGVITVT